MKEPFTLLPEPLQDVLTRLNITDPTEIEEKAIPIALGGGSVMGIAKTGTGKTLAFALPVLARLLENPRPFFALVLAPSQELASEIHGVFKLFDNIGLQTALLRGNEPFSVEELNLARSPHVVVGCPGRVLDHIANTRGFRPKRFKVLVLDECDKMLSMSLESSMNEIVKKLSPERETLLFSATFGERVRKLSEICKGGCKTLKIGEDGVLTADNLVERLVICTFADKINRLVFLLRKYPSRCIIFTEKCSDVERVYFTLKALGMSVSYIHGSAAGVTRSEEWAMFSSGAAEMLVATLECGRGLDIQDLPLVVVYDVPTPDKYTHAVGRAARAGRGGKSFLLAVKEEQEKLHLLEQHVGLRLEVERCDEMAIDAARSEVSSASSEAARAMKQLAERKDAE